MFIPQTITHSPQVNSVISRCRTCGQSGAVDMWTVGRRQDLQPATHCSDGMLLPFLARVAIRRAGCNLD